jgi:mannose/cellobiose epimerase-like protein (N-acyl-D-glucosamine 2-epimerase family)
MAARFLLILIQCLICSVSASAQYRSDLLENPDLIPDWVNTNASFWWSAYDDAEGGFYTNVGRDGTIITAWGTNKNVLTQSRDAYGMVRAFQLTGNEDYLSFARGALDFMYAHGWDPEFGGWFNVLGERGSPLDPESRKTAFDHHYALLGPMAMVEATDDTIDWEWLLRGYEFNEQALWDERPGFEGYFDSVRRDRSGAAGKSFNATVDAITTHALQLYLATGDPTYEVRLEMLAENMLDRLVSSMGAQAIGFAEKYDSDWDVLSNERLTIMGHVLKTSWCLARINQIAPNPTYVDAAEQLAMHVLDNAYDHDFGGPYKDYDRVSGEMMMWGIADTAKAWWQMEQAVVAGLELYRTTGDQRYLDMADESLDFFTTHFQDAQFGEVYADRTRSGGPIPQWGDHKGNTWKAAYHSIETGYYAYLYGKLVLHESVATLHYRFGPHSEAREITLSPLAAPPGDILIAAVRMNEQPYGDFDAESRLLRLPAGTAGHFEVDFARSSSVAAEQDIVPDELELAVTENFPNPFSGSTTIRVDLRAPSRVRLSVFDLMGREVAVLSNDYRPAGRWTTEFDASGLPAGVYVYKLKTERGEATRTMLALR